MRPFIKGTKETLYSVFNQYDKKAALECLTIMIQTKKIDTETAKEMFIYISELEREI